MYQMKNGLLYQDGKPVYGVGLSYYASYHPRKVPVPPEGDRLGEMRKDLKGMAEAGFNMVRFAALGELFYGENGEVAYCGDFTDELAREADRVGLAPMIRLQGYSTNLSGYTDGYMVDSRGKPADPSIWYNFIQNSLFHEGILADTYAATEALARHFQRICGVVCFQTYNEPHYPSPGIYDYHPAAVRAYRKWLAESGRMTKEAAEVCDPPVRRPEKGESPDAWIQWRLFSMQALSDFLGTCSDIAYQAAGVETMTCLTTDPTNSSNAARCVNFYDSAQRMNALGITHYYLDKIPEVFHACIDLDMAESAAAIYRKPMWLVEYDARTDIPPDKFRKETYLALGCGCKGILYYQWRGDHRFPDSPEGNGFGLVNDNGTPTANYENAKSTVALIRKLSDYFVNAQKLRSGVGLLYSDYAYLHSDALDNTGDDSVFLQQTNRYYEEFVRMYKALRRENISPDILRPRDLSENLLGIKVLYTASMKLLSEEERESLRAFADRGGKVITRNEDYRYKTGYIPLDYRQGRYNNDYELYDTLELCGVKADVTLRGERGLLHQTLKGKGYFLLCITNAANLEKPARNTTICTSFAFREAILYTFQEQAGRPLAVKDRSFTVDCIEDGAIILLKE